MKFLNNWQRELASGLSASETTAELKAAAGLTLAGGETVTFTLHGEVGGIEQLEIVRMTDVDGTTLTLQRGQEGTAPVIWPAGSIIEHRTTAAQLQQLQTWARAVPEDAPAEEPQRPHMRVPGGWVPYEEPDAELPGWAASADEGVAVLAAEEGRDAVLMWPADRALRVDLGGDARGAGAFDLQAVRAEPEQVASGMRSFLGPGQNCMAAGIGAAVLASDDCEALGDRSLIAASVRTVIDEFAQRCFAAASADCSISSGRSRSVFLGSSNSTISADHAVLLGSADSSITGTRGVIIGSTNAQAGGGSMVLSCSTGTADNGGAAIAGINLTADGYAAVALGGSSNEAAGPQALVAGGGSNTASGPDAVVIGGSGGQASGPSSAVIGGGGNQATEFGALAFGGSSNAASGPLSAVLAGNGNTASGQLSAVLGGNNNTCSGDLSAAFAADSCMVDAELASASGSGALSHGRTGSHTRAGVPQWPGRAPGAAQVVDLVAGTQTTDDTPAVLALAHAAPGIPMPGTAAVVATVIARTSADAAAWQLKCLVYDGGLIGTAVIDQIAASAGASGWAVDAAMATGALEITVTGPEAATCTWVADVRLTESV